MTTAAAVAVVVVVVVVVNGGSGGGDGSSARTTFGVYDGNQIDDGMPGDDTSVSTGAWALFIYVSGEEGSRGGSDDDSGSNSSGVRDNRGPRPFLEAVVNSLFRGPI